MIYIQNIQRIGKAQQVNKQPNLKMSKRYEQIPHPRWRGNFKLKE